MSDDELLLCYVETRSEPAFAVLVERHLPLIYSVAHRLVQSQATAEDIAQAVFLELAQRAHRISRGTPLVAWLHVVARRTAIDVIRRETRRRAREVAAAEETHTEVPLASMGSDQPAWSEIAYVLDEAVASLKPVDRAAVLLRFFNEKSLREIGDELGISEDAAQKKVGRALDRLRAYFVRRGISASAAGLAVTISTHAIEAAPPTLAGTIAANVSGQSAAVALSSSTHVIVMSVTQKIVTATAVVLAVGTSLFQAVVISRQRSELTVQQERISELQHDLDRIRGERDRQARELDAADTELAKIRDVAEKLAAADPAMEAALDEWLQKVIRLREYLDATPRSQIPELRYLTAKDWLDATKEGSLDTEFDFRRALSDLRRVAKQRFAQDLMAALQRYLKANNGRAPSHVAEMIPFFETSVDTAIMGRYGVYALDASDRSHPRMIGTDGRPVEWWIHEKESIDDYYDSRVWVSPAGFGAQGFSKYDYELNVALAAFASQHQDAKPTTAAQISPYLKSAIDPEFIQRRIDGRP